MKSRLCGSFFSFRQIRVCFSGAQRWAFPLKIYFWAQTGQRAAFLLARRFVLFQSFPPKFFRFLPLAGGNFPLLEKQSMRRFDGAVLPRFKKAAPSPLPLSTGRRGAPAGRSFLSPRRFRSHGAQHSGNSTTAASACPPWRPPHRRQKWRRRHVVPDKIHAADDIPVLPIETPPLFFKIIARPFPFGKGTRRFLQISMRYGKKCSSFRESSANPPPLLRKKPSSPAPSLQKTYLPSFLNTVCGVPHCSFSKFQISNFKPFPRSSLWQGIGTKILFCAVYSAGIVDMLLPKR